MNVGFENAKLAKLFNSTKALVKEHGAPRAKKIRQRMDDLRAAGTLAELRMLPGRCHGLHGELKGVLSLDLDHPYRLLFRPVGEPVQIWTDDGGLDWTRVTAVEILGVRDTHE
jgi:proteic killer suppression protein